MDQAALERLRGRDPTCPSNTDLNQLHTLELPPETAARIEAHVQGCAACQARMAERQAGFAAIPQVDAQKLLDAIKRGVQEDDLTRKRRSLRRVAYVLAPLAAAAAFLIIFMRRPIETPELPGLREKGGLALYVYKFVAGRSQRASSGDHFKAGDRLGFIADLPTAGHVNVFGVEVSGSIYVAWPGTAAEPTLRRAGKLQELPGAVELDGTKGREVLYLVSCPESVGPPAKVCQLGKVASAGTPPSCPSSCALSPFILNKQAD